MNGNQVLSSDQTFTTKCYDSSSPSVCMDTVPKTSPHFLMIIPDENSVTLKFTNYSTLITSFVIEYGTKSNHYIYSVDKVNKYLTDYTIRGLIPNTIYYFRIRASNGCSTGNWSNEMMVRTRLNITGLETKLAKGRIEIKSDEYNIKVPNVEKEPVENATTPPTHYKKFFYQTKLTIVVVTLMSIVLLVYIFSKN